MSYITLSSHFNLPHVYDVLGSCCPTKRRRIIAAVTSVSIAVFSLIAYSSTGSPWFLAASGLSALFAIKVIFMPHTPFSNLFSGLGIHFSFPLR